MVCESFYNDCFVSEHLWGQQSLIVGKTEAEHLLQHLSEVDGMMSSLNRCCRSIQLLSLPTLRECTLVVSINIHYHFLVKLPTRWPQNWHQLLSQKHSITK